MVTKRIGRHLLQCSLLVIFVGACGSADRAASDADAAASPANNEAAKAPFSAAPATAGLPPLGGMCLVFEDFTGDSWPDLLTTSPSPVGGESITMFENQRDGTFRAGAAIAPSGGFNECAAGDVDNDGMVDVVISAFSESRLTVFRNIGGGSFARAATLSAPASTTGQSGYSAVAFADFDADGLLDVVAAPFLQLPQTAPACGETSDGYACHLDAGRCMPPPVVFRNLGGGAFGPAVSVVAADTCGPANVYTIAIVDYNDDGRPDLFVPNDFGVNALYVQGETPMTFADVAPTLGLKGYNHAMGAAFADYDRDGKLDLYVSDLGSDQFYLGAVGGTLSKHGADWGVAAATKLHSGWAALAEDFDSDGFTDVWVANAAAVQSYDELQSVGEGMNLAPRVQSDCLFHNSEGAGFVLMQAPQSRSSQPQVATGASATADFDGDGQWDIAEALGYPMQLHLLHNDSAGGRWLDIRLVGHRSNRDGLGARITLSQSGQPDVVRTAQRSRGSIGASSARVHFGLGTRTSVDAITVRWPSGTMQTIAAIGSVDRVLQVDEP